MSATDLLRAELTRAARSLGAPDAIEPALERPRDPAFGDWATNLALVLAKPLRAKPRDLAQGIVKALDFRRAGIRSADVAGPGFINFRVDVDVVASGIAALIDADEAYGRTDTGQGRAVNVEFVSANPTGPSQIRKLAESVQARVRQIAGQDTPVPENGYHGEYIRDIAEQYVATHPKDPNGADLEAIRRYAVQELRKEQDIDLQTFGIKFDVYFLESSLYTAGRVEETVERLVAAGHTYEKDGALWLRTTDFGDDKDRVMRKSAEFGSDYTYFVPDVAYHVTKWERGFTRAINVQGADHHSTVTRVRVGLQALEMGMPPRYPEYVLHQMVSLLRGGEEVKFSKRTGTIVSIRELVEEVGRDAVRWFFLMRKGDSPLPFDIDLARSQSDENPVYYVQMAHARMSGIFRVGEIDVAGIRGEDADFDVLSLPEEQELMKALLDFPTVLAGAAEALEPQRLTSYLLDTARKVHLWYHKSHVLNEPEPIMRARLALARASQIVIRNGLHALGITAPERM